MTNWDTEGTPWTSPRGECVRCPGRECPIRDPRTKRWTAEWEHADHEGTAWPTVDGEMTDYRARVVAVQRSQGSGAEDCLCEHFGVVDESGQRRDGVCQKSVLRSGLELRRNGDWTYVGRQYGRALVDGHPTRILFMSMDRRAWMDEDMINKGIKFVEFTFVEIQKDFRNSALRRRGGEKGKRFNHHMAGVDLEMEYLLRPESCCAERCQQFALTNAVRCGWWDPRRDPKNQPATSRSTEVMKNRCASHTRGIIEELSPHIVIAQGAHPRRSLCRLFALREWEVFRNDKGAALAELRKGDIAGSPALFLLTDHPAAPRAGWFAKGKTLPKQFRDAFDLARRLRGTLGE